MKKFAIALLVGLGILFPVTFVPTQGNGPEDLAAELESEELLLQADTIVIQIIADADSVIAVPSVVEVTPKS